VILKKWPGLQVQYLSTTAVTWKNQSMMTALLALPPGAVFSGTLHKPIKDPLPNAVVEVMQPLFDTLGDETFLAGCEGCYAQNRNKCLHHMIWGLGIQGIVQLTSRGQPRHVSWGATI